MTEALDGDDRQAQSLKPPNRKKFEEELESYHASIKLKEDDFKSLDFRSEEQIQSDLKKLHNDRDQKSLRRQSVDSDLRKISDEIRKLETELTKVQSTLQYKNEHRINEAIQRLETQLKTRNFRLSEEKKIVAEIDSLKRSTKDLSAYLALKKQIDEKRDQQRKMRDERDRLQKMVTEIKQKEENIRIDAVNKCEKATFIKSEIDELQEEVRQLKSDFSTREKDYRHQKEEQRRRQLALVQHRKEEGRRAQEEAYKQEQEELEASREQYAEEKLLCNTMIKYLQKFVGAEDDAAAAAADKSTNDFLNASHDSKLDALNRSLEAEGIYLLRRKSNSEEMPLARTNSKVRRHKRRPSLRKPMVHTPEIFDQFSRLQLKAPVSTAEVASTISQLQDKLAYFENCSADILRLCSSRVPEVTTEPLNDPFELANRASTVSSANSYTESAVSGSMPTTPDTQFDTLKLLLTSTSHRRLSTDSGTGDVDEQNPILDTNALEDYDLCSSFRRPDVLSLDCNCKDDIPKEKMLMDPDHSLMLSPCSTIVESSSDMDSNFTFLYTRADAALFAMSDESKVEL